MNNSKDPWEEDNTQVEKTKQIMPKRINKNQVQEKNSVLSIIALICSIIAPPLGLVLSIISLHILKGNPNLKGKKFAKLGIIISIVITSLAIAVIILFSVVLKKYSVSFI